MAVDGGKNRGTKNRDKLSLDDFGTIGVAGDFGNYRCLFWPNDDHDTLHYEAEHFGDSNAWHEDDDPKFQHGTGHPNCMDNTIGAKQGKYKQTGNHSRDNHGSTEYVPLPDSQSHCLRDLEDFNRLHLKFSPLFAQVDGIQFHLTGAPVNILRQLIHL